MPESNPFPSASPPRSAASASPEMAAHIEAFDWAATPLGSRDGWSETLRVAVRLMLASATPMVILAGRKGVLIYNDSYAAFAGGRHPAIFGLPHAEAWPEIADFNNRIVEMGFRGETLSLESQELTLQRHGAPEPVWMDLEHSPLLDADGSPEGVLVIVFETTARVQTERALRRSEERLTVALDAAGVVGTWEWDIGSNRITGDTRFASMYGLTDAQAKDGVAIASLEHVIHGDDLALVYAKLEDAVAARIPFRAEYRLKREDGSSRWVLALGRVDAQAEDKPPRMSGIALDISDRKAQEAALVTSEAKFRALADTMPQMVWSTLPDGFHDYYNARWYEFTGVPIGSTDGEEWNGMFHPEDQERAWDRWRHSLATGEPYEIEYRLRHRSGQYRWTLGRALPITDAKGRIVRWFGTCTDIHDSKIAAEEREVVAQELSHRIKNIFSVLNGIIALSARSSPAAKPFADQLKQRIFAMGQAHDFVRPHSTASKPKAAQTSLKALAEKLLSPFAEPSRHNIRFEGEDAVIDEAAATPLALIFHELATNAAKYGSLSTGRGTVTLTGYNSGDDYLLDWKEAGARDSVSAPQREGFGTRLMGLSVEGQLGGTVRRFWEPDGLHVAIVIPRAALRRPARLYQTPEAHIPLRQSA